ncbi:3-deoxy-7-phosphoheptulonate synthase [Photorhabdus kayaii]|nr:3-deoxy-7-phosphoheptulonate synthase [Photorhabdus kayaii]
MGDCAERVIACDQQSVTPKIDFLHNLSEIFSTLLNKTVITVGRILLVNMQNRVLMHLKNTKI